MRNRAKQLLDECEFRASRSSGPGGQNVNKVNTRIELRFNIEKSTLLSEFEKLRVYEKLSGRISKENILILTANEERSQLRNKELAMNRFITLISAALFRPKIRKKTRATKASRMRRLERKKKHSIKKVLRKKPE